MENENYISIGDLVKVSKPFFSHSNFNFNIESKYDLGIVINKKETVQDKCYCTILLNSNNIIFRHIDEVIRIS